MLLNGTIVDCSFFELATTPLSLPCLLALAGLLFVLQSTRDPDESYLTTDQTSVVVGIPPWSLVVTFDVETLRNFLAAARAGPDPWTKI